MPSEELPANKMSTLRRFVLRLVSFFRSTRAEAELAREIEAHLQLLEDQFAAGGMSRGEARLAARRAFGGQVEQVKERQRDARSFRWIGNSWLDLKLGARMLVKYPGLTVIAVFALSVAIASGAAYLEFTNDMFRPKLPFKDGDRIVRVQNFDQATGDPEARALYDFQAWKEGLTSVEHLGASTAFERNLITDDGRAEPVHGVEISATAFRIIPTPPLLGRPLIAEDEQLAAPAVAVIGHSLWQSRFDGDTGIVGRAIQLGNTTHTVVGVMPEGFGFPVNHSLWVPFRATAAVRRGDGPALRVFGRLAPGVALEAAQAELSTMGQRLAGGASESTRRLQPRINPYLGSRFSSSEDRVQMMILYGANLFFLGLLGVCGANVATLVFARTATREGEITVRTALGASRTRIVAQLFAEALVLSSIAAGVGLFAASYLLRWGKEQARIGANDGAPAPFWWNDVFSVETWVYTGVLALVAAAIVGIVPALKATGAHMQARLSHSAGRGASLKVGGVWTAVIVGQIAFTVLFLMIGVTILMEAYGSRHETMDAGFARAEYLSLQLGLDSDTAAPVETEQAQLQARLKATYEELARRLSSEPGVRKITYGSVFPGKGVTDFFIEFRDIETPVLFDGSRLWVRTGAVATDYFETFNAPIVAGRAFTQTDAELDRPVAIVDQTFVSKVLGGRNPIGQFVRQSQDADHPQPGPWYEIVGVVGDLNNAPKKRTIDAMLYRPAIAGRAAPMRMFVHVAGDGAAFTPQLRRIAADLDPTLRLYDFRRLDRINESEDVARAFFLRVVAIVSGVALVLASAGIYAVMSFTVTRRTREIGIRVAVGADQRRVLTGIFSRGLAQVGLGIVVGSVPGIALAAYYPDGIGEAGPLLIPAAVIAIAAFILGVSLLACLVPARRALQIHPTDALRADA